MPSGMAGAMQRSASAAAVDDPQIELVGVRKEFGDSRHKVVAVEGADLAVGDGELFAILGPSGSGKTTVLRMIAGFEQPTAGVIRLGGVDVTALPARPSRRQHRLPGLRAVPPHDRRAERRVRAEGQRRAARGAPPPHLATRWTWFGCPARRHASPHSCRAASASAWRWRAHWSDRPRVLLLDEPLGALDLKLREQMQVELKAIQREVGITFVIVTHDQDEALTLCDRLAVFNNGRIEQVGSGPRGLREPGQSIRRRLRRHLQRARRRRRRGARRAGRARSSCGRSASRSSSAGTDPVQGVRTVDATGVAEVIYAGPTTQIAAVTAAGRHAHRHGPDREHLAATRPAARHPNRPWRGRTKRRSTNCPNRGVAMRIIHHPNRTGPRRLRGADRRLLELPGIRRRRASRPPKMDTAESHSATAKASSTSSPGPATPRTAPTTRPSTG